ncbi:macrophage mannose receptor 1-like [Anneissia japonica]|uniref:macrophage mannose receptor 1-like n=1 Tax=Anneissia japonica TaxID=1529436 RepID=UPI001425B647|nr:macrophage mannose receptor 1-like [Anneissia japonica]
MQQQINMNQFVGLCLLGFLATSLACQDGWQSYNGHCYKLFPSNTRNSAATGCHNEGAYLACVEDQAENQFISGVANNNRAFLGHTDQGTEGVWRCAEVPTMGSVWWRGEPNNCCGGEDCAEINFGGRSYWNDVRCTARFPSVCEKEGPCEDGWNEHEGRCYRKFQSALNFDEAENNCVNHGGHLACIDSDNENSYVADLAGGRAWIGHNDRNHERVWMCTGEDGNSPSPWRAASNEPNNCCGGEHCAETNFGGTALWNDLSCGGSLPYVCEKQDEQEQTSLMNCDEGWTLHNGNCYKQFPGRTFENAFNLCREEDASIVCIDNPEENTFIADLTNGERAFIGTVDTGSEGIWHCARQNSGRFEGEIWWRGEPNNCCGGENCAEINFGSRGRWNDCGCHARLGYVCEKSGPNCDSGWDEYNGNCYQHSSSGTNWQDAMATCQRLNAYLVCIGDNAENTFVANLANGGRAWIGSTDAGHEGAWMCTGENGNESPWWNGEPNDWGSGEDCAETNFHQRGRWNDIRCSASFPFVCEKSAYTPVLPCDFLTNFFTHCVTDSRDECAALVTAMASLEDGCDANREFLGGMTGHCAVQNN